MKDIKFIENYSESYVIRTKLNCCSDVTIAFATDWDSKGEILTKNSVKFLNKKWIGIDLKNLELGKERMWKVYKKLLSSFEENRNKNIQGITVNIAGNGVYTLLPKGITQEILDDFVYKLLFEFNTLLNDSITLIRSGGQTGADESGIKAALKLGIPCEVNFPKGWKFRNSEGKDIFNKELFLERFNGYL
jgi:hypothetical protein